MEDFGSFTASREPAQREFSECKAGDTLDIMGPLEMDSL